MTSYDMLSLRSFLTTAAALSAAPAFAKGKKVAVGLELYSVPYFDWTPERAKEIRKLLDDLGIRCFSTHNGSASYAPENLAKAIELNQILGSKIIVMASSGRVEGLDGWKAVADKLNAGAEKMKAAGISAGYHNHQTEFKPLGGTRPIEVLAKNTTKDVVLQLDVGTVLEAGSDPVAWIQQNPGRIRSIHCKDWSPDAGKGYKVLFGDGVAPWKKIFAAAEKVGGVEYYLIEQEGYSLPSPETAEKCLAAFKKIHG
ncbi:MAG: sugar phosphate isomerase/epimerase [Acidobacteria bacterium]|nr:sugar phosphate isomerase/epimerase [Acidobacteriota bacterium]